MGQAFKWAIFSDVVTNFVVILWVYYTIIPFAFSLFWHFLVITFQLLNNMFGSGSLMSVQFPKYAYGPYRYFNKIKNGIYSLVEVSIWVTNLDTNIFLCSSRDRQGFSNEKGFRKVVSNFDTS